MMGAPAARGAGGVRFRILPTLAAAALLVVLAPAGEAGWMHRGTNEPDTDRDDPSFLWFDRDVVRGDRIYFNAWPEAVPRTTVNPNVAGLHTGIEPAVVRFGAMLGIWMDCNDDRYVGHSELGLMEYRPDAALSNACAKLDPNGQATYPFFDGTWVRELIWLGPETTSEGDPRRNPTNVYADGILVWGDWGGPDDLPERHCAVPPVPGSLVVSCSPVSAPAGPKTEPDLRFRFYPGTRDAQGLVHCQRTASGTSAIAHPQLGYCPPLDLGAGVVRGRGPVGPAWASDELWAGMRSASVGVGTITLDDGQRATFYASLPPSILGSFEVPGGIGQYGSSRCGEKSSGVQNGWDCSVANWQAQCAASGMSANCPHPETLYQLRDVDCLDGRVGGSVGVGLPFYGAGWCAPHPLNPRPTIP